MITVLFSKHLKNLIGIYGTLKSSSTMASAMGTTMAVVAVFEIHMDENIVVSMKPNINLVVGKKKILIVREIK